eukprot:TRINITY_DN46938_c0_g1_i1.p1 TRINITY_DN46938_c0_g1~~TRINITY_DN46938_c0_g1_i1.p1  ORF type:complete len:333 (+),score=84.01 TRINITY_DN46938_c0_g1_i1:58-999(+)
MAPEELRRAMASGGVGVALYLCPLAAGVPGQGPQLVHTLRECHQSGRWAGGDVGCCCLIAACLVAVGMLVVAAATWLLRRGSPPPRQPEPPALLLPPRDDARFSSPLTVVLDLDETLVSFGDNAFDRDGWEGVRHRPGLARLGDCLRSLGCEVVVWTAATRPYARAVMTSFARAQGADGLPAITAHHTVNRDTGRWFEDGGFAGHVKDLRLLGRDLSRTVMVENRALSCLMQKENCVLVPDYFGPRRRKAPDDVVLSQLCQLLTEMERHPDVPTGVRASCLTRRRAARLLLPGEQGSFYTIGTHPSLDRPKRG